MQLAKRIPSRIPVRSSKLSSDNNCHAFGSLFPNSLLPLAGNAVKDFETVKTGVFTGGKI